MNAADSVNSAKPVDPGLHGMIAPLPPDQLPFDLVLRAKLPARPSAVERPGLTESNHRSAPRSKYRDRVSRSDERSQESIQQPSQVRPDRTKVADDAPFEEQPLEPSDDAADDDRRDETTSPADAVPATSTVPIASAPGPEVLPLTEADVALAVEPPAGPIPVPQDGDASFGPAGSAESTTTVTPIDDAAGEPATNHREAARDGGATGGESLPAAQTGVELPTSADAPATNNAGEFKVQSEAPSSAAIEATTDAAPKVDATDHEPANVAPAAEYVDAPSGRSEDPDQGSADREAPSLADSAPSGTQVPPGESQSSRVPFAAEVAVPPGPPAAVQAPANSNGSSTPVATAPSPATRPMSHFLSRNEEAAGRPDRPVEVQQSRLVHRVARAFQVAQQRGGDLKLRLSPPELGSLKIELRVQDGVMSARLETETQSARTALVESLPALRERLAEQGIRIDRFDVDLMQQQGHGPGPGDQGSQWESGRVGEWENRRTGRPPAETPHSPPSSPPLPHTNSNGLNVLV